MDIDFKNISLGYNKSLVLESVDLSLSNNDTIGVIGKNGSGKSTLINSLFDCNLIKSGKISFKNEKSAEPVISYVPQELYFPDFLTVNEYLKLHIEKHKIDDLVKKYSLESFLNKEMNQLSGGEKRRITLFAAFYREPDILLLDEPDTHLDPVQICAFSTLFSEIIQTSNALTLIVSNRVDFLKGLCSKFITVANKEAKLYSNLTSDLINECYK